MCSIINRIKYKLILNKSIYFLNNRINQANGKQTTDQTPSTSANNQQIHIKLFKSMITL